MGWVCVLCMLESRAGIKEKSIEMWAWIFGYWHA